VQKVSATEFARNLRKVLDRIGETGEEYIVERGKRPVVKLSPVPEGRTAQEVMADLYRVLPDRVGDEWLEDARRGRERLSSGLFDGLRTGRRMSRSSTTTDFEVL
jgi:antitoxin (DNA-binding transcriptional repressor) of toxin-antitoxin stability system